MNARELVRFPKSMLEIRKRVIAEKKNPVPKPVRSIGRNKVRKVVNSRRGRRRKAQKAVIPRGPRRIPRDLRKGWLQLATRYRTEQVTALKELAPIKEVFVGDLIRQAVDDFLEKQKAVQR
jgi:hypothetical protein